MIKIAGPTTKSSYPNTYLSLVNVARQSAVASGFNGEREFLTKEEADLHDKVFYHEALEQWDDMLKCKDKFSRLNPKAYMTLLD